MPGATGPEDVSWARRQIEHEFSSRSPGRCPWGAESCHPSIIGVWAWMAASNPVTATTAATIKETTASRVTRYGLRREKGRIEAVTLAPTPWRVKRGQGVSPCPPANVFSPAVTRTGSQF